MTLGGSGSMFGSVLLDVVTGLTFFYMLTSLALSSLGETISWACKLRNGMLDKALQTIFGDERLVDAFFDHPLVRGLNRTQKKATGQKLISSKFFRFTGLAWLAKLMRIPALLRRMEQDRPSYVSSRTFAFVMSDMLHGDIASVKKRFGPDIDIDQNQLDTLRDRFACFVTQDVSDTRDSTNRLQLISQWFDDRMERVSGWYKRLMQKILLTTAIGMSVALNADTIMIASMLWNDSEMREAVLLESAATVERAKSNMTANRPSSTETAKRSLENDSIGKTDLSALGLVIDSRRHRPFPIGWPPPASSAGSTVGAYDPRAVSHTFQGYFHKVIGLLITGLLISLGAPFWFDTLSKLINMRATGIRPRTEAQISQQVSSQG